MHSVPKVLLITTLGQAALLLGGCERESPVAYDPAAAEAVDPQLLTLPLARVPKGTEVTFIVPTGTGPLIRIGDQEFVLTYTAEPGESVQGGGRGCLQAQVYAAQTVVFRDLGGGPPSRVDGALTLSVGTGSPAGPMPAGTRLGNLWSGFQCMIGSDFFDWYSGTVL